MSYNKKLKKVVDKISDNNDKNFKLMNKNLELFRCFNDGNYLFRELMLIHIEEEQIIKFMKVYFSYLKDNNVNYVKEIKKSLNLREHRQNGLKEFVYTAVEEEYSLSFIDSVLEIVNKYIVADNKQIKYSDRVYDLFLDYTLPGKNLVYLYLQKAINNNINISDDIDKLSRMLKKYNVDISVPFFDSSTALSLLEDLDVDKQNIMTNEQLLKLKQLIYKTSINGMLSHNKNKDLDNINRIFGDINYCDEGGSLLHYCLKVYYYVNGYRTTDKYIIENLNYLLELGVDPNLKDVEGKSFIEMAIDLSNNPNYAISQIEMSLEQLIESLLKKSFNQGFDINLHPKLFELFLRKIKYPTSPINVYKTLCINGYKSYGFDSAYDILYSKFYNDMHFDDPGLVFLINLYTCNRYREQLIWYLNSKSFDVEDDFVKKYNDILCDGLEDILNRKGKVYTCPNKLIYEIMYYLNFSESAFFDNWAVTVIKLRDESIIVQNNKVTLDEVLNALNHMMIEKVNDTNKTNKTFNNCKQKIIYYRNKLKYNQ